LPIISHTKVIFKKSPCLWTLVWSCNPCFIVNLSVQVRFSVARYFIHKIWRTFFWQDHLVKNTSSNEYARMWGGAHVRTNLGEETSFVPSCLHVSCFHLDFLIWSPVLAKLLRPHKYTLLYRPEVEYGKYLEPTTKRRHTTYIKFEF
jgi:hypothetical protein